MAETEAAAINALLALARATLDAADNSEDCDTYYKVESADFIRVSEALDALDKLPDDQPGVIMTGPAAAEWALRNVLRRATDPAVAELVEALKNFMNIVEIGRAHV